MAKNLLLCYQSSGISIPCDMVVEIVEAPQWSLIPLVDCALGLATWREPVSLLWHDCMSPVMMVPSNTKLQMVIIKDGSYYYGVLSESIAIETSSIALDQIHTIAELYHVY